MRSYLILLLSLLFLFISLSFSPTEKEELSEAIFKNPPIEYAPKTWMHAMSGNMSKAGLTKDLEAMAKAGLGGLLLFNITQGIPNGPIIYDSKEHHEMLVHAATEAERLGLSFGVHNCDGWSASGGPWITPEQSMKMVVWSEATTKGGKINLQLAQPTTREGLYEDIAVFAYPAFSVEREAQTPKITASDADFDIELATNGRWEETSTISKKGDDLPWIQFEYERPQTLRSAFLVFKDRHGEVELLTSDDGKNFASAGQLKKVRTGKGEWAIADQFEPQTARFFRLQLNQSMRIKEVQLSPIHTIDNILGRVAMARTEDMDFKELPTPNADMVINQKNLIDLSKNLDASGRLQAELPKGDWTILRFGYTSTAAFNNPASEEGRGLEVDKLSRAALKTHYDSFIKEVVNNAKPLAPNSFQYVEIDSYEMGGQNWTDDFDDLFQERYGYSFKAFLPIIAGRFVENEKVTEAVLWDYRNLIADLFTENYFGYFSELCHEDGIKSYIEPYGFGPLNDLEVGSKADLMMGEFWMNRPFTMLSSAISSAHIYGKNLISAESFTSRPEVNWGGHPAMVKVTGDRAWARGVNEFMFHRFAHQANTNVVPGMTMNRWGFHFDRTQTWWYNAGAAWFDYVARGSYLLRQGVPVSDVLVFIGDGAPNSVLKREELGIPMGTNFDCVNADVLINRMEVKNSKLVLPEGTSYQLLVLKNADHITLPTLKRLVELQTAGAIIAGDVPENLGGFGHSKATLAEFEELKNSLQNGQLYDAPENWESLFQEIGLKKDCIIKDRIDIDFAHRKTADTDIYFIHNPDSIAQNFELSFRVKNKIPELWNPMNGDVKKLAAFEQTEEHTKIHIQLEAEASTFVIFRTNSDNINPIVNEPKDKFHTFYVLSENGIRAIVREKGNYTATLSDGQSLSFQVDEIQPPFVVDESWMVDFQFQDQYLGRFRFDELTDWSQHPNDTIKYFSGTATYTTSFDYPKKITNDQRFYLNLGEVHIAAEIILNGENIGVTWIKPHRIEITEALQTGKNELTIKLTNQWSNRLIGDERFPKQDNGYRLGRHGSNPNLFMPEWYVKNEPLPDGPRTTFSTASFYKNGDELYPSGLLGPVRIDSVLEVDLPIKK